MAQKALVLGMILSLHSLGIIFASLFTFKWYIDDSRDVGIFGICEYFNSSSLDQFETNQMPSSKKFSNVSYKINTISLKNGQKYLNKVNDSKLNEFMKILDFLPQAAQLSADKPSTSIAKTLSASTLTTKAMASKSHVAVKRASLSEAEAATIIGMDVKPLSNDNSYSILQDYATTYQKCFQLLWPNTDDAFEYLTSKCFIRIFLLNKVLFCL